MQASAAFGKVYHVGERFGTLEFGGKSRNEHKYNNTNSPKYTVNKGVTIPVAQFAGSFTDPNYYDNAYPWPSKIPDFTQVGSDLGCYQDAMTKARVASSSLTITRASDKESSVHRPQARIVP